MSRSCDQAIWDRWPSPRLHLSPDPARWIRIDPPVSIHFWIDMLVCLDLDLFEETRSKSVAIAEHAPPPPPQWVHKSIEKSYIYIKNFDLAAA